MLEMDLIIVFGVLSLLYAVFGYSCGVYELLKWCKKIWAKRIVKKWKKSLDYSKFTWEDDCPRQLGDTAYDNHTIYGSNNDGCSLYISFTRFKSRISNLIVIFTLKDGTVYQLPNPANAEYIRGSENSWNGAGLSLTLVDAFKRWRIVFNGLMKSTNGKEELKHVRFNFIWVFASTPSKFPQDYSEPLLLEYVAAKPWKDLLQMTEVVDLQSKGYDQFGSFIGFYILENTTKPQTLGLHGFRRRRLGCSLLSSNSSFSLIGTASDGIVYTIQVEYITNSSVLKYGIIRLPQGKVLPIDSIELDTELFHKNISPPKSFTAIVSAQKYSFTIFITLNKTAIMEHCGSTPKPWASYIIPYQVGVNAYQGFGFMNIQIPSTHHTKSSISQQSMNKHLSWLDVNKDDTVPVCTTFTEQISCCPAVVGGKAASLSLLSSVASSEFIVPNGFCLTKRAMEIQIKHNSVLLKVVQDIHNVASNYSESNMKEYCSRATWLFENTPIDNELKNIVSSHYEKLCEYEKQNGKVFVAVRSSGIGEDSEDLSAAGQNATILGCASLEEVLVGVQKCWASLFTFQSVEYRRQYGQELNCGMGVVIQVMVESDTAGVMFTKHPSTGDPRELLITSSYGLGESVVSGHVDPDTIVIKVNGDQLEIKSYDIGMKNQKIILDHTGNQQTLCLGLEEDTQKKSLSEEQCLALARIGLEQETLWGSPRDIEWAIVKGRIYLLQARPITCLNNWTEFELMHEMDTAIMSPDDVTTFANIGEVLPGAASLLTQSVLTEALDKSIQMKQDIQCLNDEYRPMYGLPITHHHIGINLLNLFVRFPDKQVNVQTKISDIAICGHEVTNDKILSIAVHRHGLATKFRKMLIFLDMVKCLWRNKHTSKLCQDISERINIDIMGKKSALEMYHEFIKCFDEFITVGYLHNETSNASILSQFVFLSTILGSANTLTSENYQDIGVILSSCSNVVSAEIPEILKNIANDINKSEKASEFGKQKPEEALDWLKVNIPNVYLSITKFLKKHGHRCIKEIDLLVEPWALDPTPLMRTLQMSYSIPIKENSHQMTVDELIGKLVTPISSSTRRALKFIIPMCQSSVTRREMTKAALISVTHKIRLASRHLGEQMVREWRIPDSKLIYMMTVGEIQRLLISRDPSIVIKAKLRRRYFDKWSNLQFNEINWGFPQPVENYADKLLYLSESSDVVIHGTPVCSGDVIGRACVIRDVSLIDDLQHGDILVTHGTDIGWSPYFPMLSGVVTELGGLISHGAVVAREYGLPCIVGAQGATNVFKTGDVLLLSAGNGTLKKIHETS